MKPPILHIDDLDKKRENVMLLVMDLIPRIPYVDELKEVDEILLD